MASITKTPTGKYRVFIRRQGLKPITKTFIRKTDARAFANRLEGDKEARLAHGTVTSTMTMGDLIGRFTDQYQGKDQGTLSRLRWWKEEYGGFRIIDMDRNAVREALAELAKGMAYRGHGRIKGRIRTKPTNRPRSPATVNRYKASLSSVFEYGKNEHDLADNPCRQIKARTEAKGRVRFLSDVERKALLEACRASQWKRLYLLVALALTTGARLGELLSLRWEDVDLKTRRAFIRETKNGSDRVLPLTKDIVVELMKHRGIGLVFPSERRINRPFEFRKQWNIAVETAELKNFRFHDLRHSAASHLAMNGATLLEIAEVLGHRDTTVTCRYSHLCSDHKQKLIDNLMGSVLEG